MEAKKILIVEDSPALAASLKDALEMHEFEPLVAKNGQEGVSMALEHKPDLILLDIRLPDISGYEVFRQIREDSWGKKARISILTASESLEEISKNVDLPIEYVLFKPDQSLTDLLAHITHRVQN